MKIKKTEPIISQIPENSENIIDNNPTNENPVKEIKFDRFSNLKKRKDTGPVVKKINDVGDKKLRNMSDEVWKTIDFADERYEISSYGRVKSYYYNPDGAILRSKPVNGYYSFTCKCNNVVRKCLVHKVVAQYFVPKDDENQTVVTHIDWNLLNNHYTNLKWITKEESIKNVFKHLNELSRLKPQKPHTSKLKESDISRLKEMLRKGVKQNVIAKLFQLSEMQITRIKRGENWGHIK